MWLFGWRYLPLPWPQYITTPKSNLTGSLTFGWFSFSLYSNTYIAILMRSVLAPIQSKSHKVHLEVVWKLLLPMLKLPYQAGTLIGLPGTNSSALGVSLPVENNTDKNFKLVLQWGLHLASTLAGTVQRWWSDGNPASHFQKRKSKGLHNMIWFREGWLWERNSRSFRAWEDAVSWRAHSLDAHKRLQQRVYRPHLPWFKSPLQNSCQKSTVFAAVL